MCTYIVEKAEMMGSGKGQQGWFEVTQANVAYDHAIHAWLEHSLNIDFVNEAMGPNARVAVELSADSARALVKAILTALERGDDAHPTERSTKVPATV